jgi:hypothetical protein
VCVCVCVWTKDKKNGVHLPQSYLVRPSPEAQRLLSLPGVRQQHVEHLKYARVQRVSAQSTRETSTRNQASMVQRETLVALHSTQVKLT